MRKLFSNPKALAIIIIVFLMVIVGRLFFNAPVAHIQISSETVGHNIFGKLNITNTLITAWITCVVLVAIAFFATRKMALVPKGFQATVEWVVDSFYGLVESIAGKSKARMFFPLVATIFLFVLVSNWMGLIPIWNTVGNVDSSREVIFKEAKDKAKNRVPVLGVDEQAVKDKIEELEKKDAGLDKLVADGYITDNELSTIKLHVFDKVGPFRVLPIGYNLQKETTAACALDRPTCQDKDRLPANFETTHELGLMVPYFRSANSDVMTTLAIALVAMFMAECGGIQANASFSYARRFLNLSGFKKGAFLGMIELGVGFLEAISEFAKIISFTFRLFGNIFAGEVLLFSLVFLLPFLIPFLAYGLETFVGFIQALVFSILTLVFASMATMSHEGGHEGEGHKAEHAGQEAQQPAQHRS